MEHKLRTGCPAERPEWTQAYPATRLDWCRTPLYLLESIGNREPLSIVSLSEGEHVCHGGGDLEFEVRYTNLMSIESSLPNIKCGKMINSAGNLPAEWMYGDCDSSEAYICEETFDLTGKHAISGGAFWIGLNDIKAEGEFKWLDGGENQVNYTDWDAEQPGGGRRQNCVIINQKSVTRPRAWNDVNCGMLANIICEKFADCQNNTHGMACRYDCGSTHCANKTCDRITGVCLNGCEPGYRGMTCDEDEHEEEKQKTIEKQLSVPLWIINGLLAAAASVLACSVMAVVVK
ncbi:C-type lectin domain family 3 member A [Elysia marginata]|uniref:C-type lectin domain family 3 member A n=1 Tax=Elysia marginata TaxID=1093978 RepID=A0AAV4GZS4_9GAST|nr:C-type lectin domain family 3 member A [Elysia marginata]